MYEWSDEQRAIAEAVRRFVDDEIRPVLDDLEFGDLRPTGSCASSTRRSGSTSSPASSSSASSIARSATSRRRAPRRGGERGDDAHARSSSSCKVSPGLVTALGVSTGLAGGTIMKLGTPEQMERFGLDLLTLRQGGLLGDHRARQRLGRARRACARRRGATATSTCSTARRPGSRTARTPTRSSATRSSTTARDIDLRHRPVVTFILSPDMEGLERSAPLRKMGQHASPTGELFFSDVRVRRGPAPRRDRDARGRRAREREGQLRHRARRRRGDVARDHRGVPAPLGRLRQVPDAVGQPIAEFQLIQLKLARMEVARVNTQNLVFRTSSAPRPARRPTLAEASAMKLYAAQAAFDVADEAIQLFGGNGYVSEYRVEQLARDARVLQIYAGTDEMQVVAIAKDLLSRSEPRSARSAGARRTGRSARPSRRRRSTRRTSSGSARPTRSPRANSRGARLAIPVVPTRYSAHAPGKSFTHATSTASSPPRSTARLRCVWPAV